MIRKCIFWAHLVVGLLVGVVVLALCVTGGLLAFEKQIVDWAERDPRALPPSPSAERVHPSVLVANAAKLHPGKVSNVEWLADPQAPARLYYADRSLVLLNGWSGEVLGRGAASLRAFFRTTTTVHLNLALLGTGKWMVDFSNAAFIFLGLSGLWLWWPRHWRWKALRSSIAIRFAVRGKARDWNWHNALGFWFLVPLLIITITGLVLSFNSVDMGWRDFAGKHLLAPAKVPPVLSLASGEAPGWNGVMNAVIRHCSGWHSIMLTSPPANTQGVASLMVSMGPLGQRTLIRNVSVDQASNTIVKIKTWENEETGPRARMIARFGHTGEILGTWGQILGAAACLAGVVLVYTGFALSWRRFFPRRRQKV
jgi:uncharacterized iron-regulated membrane protein